MTVFYCFTIALHCSPNEWTISRLILLKNFDSDHNDIPYHTAVRWLSLGKVLDRVWELKPQIRQFLEIKGKQNDFPQFENTEWLSDFAFMVDLFGHMNELNTKLLG